MHYPRSSAILFGFFLAAAPLFSSASRDFVARSGFYGPRAELRYARPTLWWEIWSETGSVTASAMEVNGASVDARYDPDFRSLRFTPSQPLSPGVYKVHCAVTFSGGYTFTKDWDATVGTGALGALPEPTGAQNEALDQVNKCRSALGLPAFVADPRLNVAAQAHAEYMTRNGTRGHTEKPTDPGFTGADPSGRLETYGWGGASWEGLTYGQPNVRQAIVELFDAPYHRLPFMEPGSEQFGFGISSGNATTEYEGSSLEAVTVSPSDGQADAPPSWFSHETPDPLAIHPEASKDRAVGYPIMLAQFGAGKNPLQVGSASLTDSAGKAVEIFINSPANDRNLSNSVVLIPTGPLKPGQLYKVTFSGTGINGNPLQKSWSFQTAK